MAQRRKVAVIGSNSFSGSDFIDLLLEEKGRNDVIGISRSPEKSALFLPYKRHRSCNFKFYQLNLNNDIPELVKLLDSFQPEYIVNFAAQSEVAPSWEYPQQWFQTNVITLTELANALKDRRYLKRYIQISSPEVYGTCKGVVKEDAQLNPSTPYAASKAAGDLSLFTFFKQFGFPLVIIRSTNVYGAHQQLFKIIPRSVIYIKLGKVIELHGAGKAIKSYIHIRDISRGELSVMENGTTGQIYHLSPDRGLAVRDVVKIICDKRKVDFDEATKIVDERPGQDSAYIIDSSKARSELGWMPLIQLEDGIEGVIDWIDREWNLVKGETFEYVHKP